MIPTDRTIYLEVAKRKRHDRKWVMMCLGNVLRIMNKEKATVQPVTTSNDFDLDWNLTG